ncbi:MAG: histidine kinase [Candidatus Choladocola sp.]|nr:histidine kinase [Candidatus Choladocola sp.]
MSVILDKCLLMLCCFPGTRYTADNTSFIIVCFISVAFASLIYAVPDSRFHLTAVTFSAVLLLFLPDLCIFFPLIFYDYFSENTGNGRLTITHSCIPALVLSILGLTAAVIRQNNASFVFFLLTGCLLSAILRYKTDAYRTLHTKYLQTKDDDTEIQLLLEEKNKSLREKQDSEIYAATLRERNRIAREIHDNVGHMLTRSILMTGALRTVNRSSELEEPLQHLDTTLNCAMDSIRQSVHDLHDSSVNLEDSLKSMIHEFTFCPVILHYEMSPALPRNLKYSFISITKEALVNIAKHSNATEASVTVMEHPGFYQLIIQDNGTKAVTGPMESLISSTGIGLANMDSRIRSLGGNFQIQSASGFRIYITVPKNSTET